MSDRLKEVAVSHSLEEAEARVKRAMAQVGQLAHAEPGERVEGTVRCGFQSVWLSITWRPAATGTFLVFRMGGGDLAGKAAEDAVSRLMDAYLNGGEETYRPSRSGCNPWLVILALLFGMCLFFRVVATLVG